MNLYVNVSKIFQTKYEERYHLSIRFITIKTPYTFLILLFVFMLIERYSRRRQAIMNFFAAANFHCVSDSNRRCKRKVQRAMSPLRRRNEKKSFFGRCSGKCRYVVSAWAWTRKILIEMKVSTFYGVTIAAFFLGAPQFNPVINHLCWRSTSEYRSNG